MNPHCQCACAGFCTRHQMDKNETLHQLCQGKAPSRDCGWKYWQMWERGHGGATAPSDPIPSPEPFCDPNHFEPGSVPCSGCTGQVVKRPSIVKTVSNAAQAVARFIGDGMKLTSKSEQDNRLSICNSCPLNEAGRCLSCNCILSLKVQSRTERCPAGKWFEDAREPRPLGNVIRNLIMHVFPVASNENWKANLREIAKRIHLFDGRKVLSISVDSRDTVAGRQTLTVSADEVIEFSKYVGIEWDVVEAFANDSGLGEVKTFLWKMEQIKSINNNEVTFYCHSKGVTHADNTMVRRWTDQMYHTLLDDWPSVQNALERFSVAGSFRKYGIHGNLNTKWHYSGTFFWFRHDDTFKNEAWSDIDAAYYGTESWPGRVFRVEQSACLFSDDDDSAYLQTTWDAIEPKVTLWDEARK